MEHRFKECSHHNICLYNELLIQIGFEECVEIRRKVKEFEVNRKDQLSLLHPNLKTICTGSVAEGFRHGQTDRDYMKVLKDITVLDSDTEILYSREPDKTVLLSINKDPVYWNEGYVILKCIGDGKIFADGHQECIDYAKTNQFVSSYRFKEWWVTYHSNYNVDVFMHGPCVSISGLSSDQDIAFSLECGFWPSQAREWLNRTRVWPSQKLVDEIAMCGCHLVPLGPIKDMKDDLLWRVSFNNAEKKLVYAFNQTQFLCYGLLKIVLKECIEKLEYYPGNTLCSYFIKTLLFWIIQDTTAELWQPHNIVICFVVCLVRLTVWVKRESCPNFFIPSRNMFKLKVQGHAKARLLQTLKEVHKMGVWNCFAMCSKRFHINTHHTNSITQYIKPYFVDQSYLRECRVLSFSFLVDDLCAFDKMYTTLNVNPLSELELQFSTCQQLSMYQRKAIQSNKIKYLRKAKELDLTRGPLMLATNLYCEAEYLQVVQMIGDVKASLGKFTFCAGINNADILNYNEVLAEYVFSHECRKFSLEEKRRKLLAMDILIHKVTDVFTKAKNERNIPKELWFDLLFQRMALVVHPLVYLYFLEFLCYKHLLRNDKATTARSELENIVLNVCKFEDRPIAHLILGITYEENKRYDDALRHYDLSLSLRSRFTSALCRGYLVKKFIKLCLQDRDYGID